MTHITEARVIGSHADMGGSAPAVARIPPAVACIPMTVPDMLRAGRRRTLGRREMIAAQSTWDSEGGATREGESRPNGRGVRMVVASARPGYWFLNHLSSAL